MDDHDFKRRMAELAGDPPRENDRAVFDDFTAKLGGAPMQRGPMLGFGIQQEGDPIGAPLDQIIQQREGGAPPQTPPGPAPLPPGPRSPMSPLQMASDATLGGGGGAGIPGVTAPVPLPPSVPLSQRLANNVGANAQPAGAPLPTTPAGWEAWNANQATKGAPPLPSPVAGPGLTAAAAHPVPAGGGAGFGKLEKTVAADNDRLLGTYDKQMTDEAKLGQAQDARMQGMAGANERAALEQQRAIEQQQKIEVDAQQRAQGYLAKSQQLADDLREQKIDPTRLYSHVSMGTKMGVVIGGILGGMLQARQGGENQFLKTLNGLVDRDVQAQQENYLHQKDSLSARNTVFGQMMQASGDQRLAALQARSGMLDAAKFQIEGTAQRLGGTEMLAKSQLAVDGIGQQQAELKKQIDVLALQAARQQAAAAASAAAAREKLLWERQVETVKLGQHQQEIDQAGEKTGKGSKEDLEQRTQGYGKTLQDKDVQARENAIARLRAQTKGGDGIPGVGRWGDTKAWFIGGEGSTIGKGLSGLAFSDQERVNRNDWAQLKLQYVHEITGAGGPPEEKAMIQAAMEGAKTPAEQVAALDKAQEYVDRYKATARGTFGPDAEAEFQRRMMPPTVKMK